MRELINICSPSNHQTTIGFLMISGEIEFHPFAYILFVWFFFMVRLNFDQYLSCLTLSWWRPLSYRNQSIDLQRKSLDWFLDDNDLRHKRVNSSRKCLLKRIKFAGKLYAFIVLKQKNKRKIKRNKSFQYICFMFLVLFVLNMH